MNLAFGGVQFYTGLLPHPAPFSMRQRHSGATAQPSAAAEMSIVVAGITTGTPGPDGRNSLVALPTAGHG
jgi:hypothetical protein